MEGRWTSICIRSTRTAIVAAGWLATSQAQAAQVLGDLDWRRYLDWHSYTHAQLLLGGSLALLVVALIMRTVRKSRTADDAEAPGRLPGDRYTRRIGTMPLEPVQSSRASE